MLYDLDVEGDRVPVIQAALLMTLPPISLPSLAMLERSFPARILAIVVLRRWRKQVTIKPGQVAA